MKGTIAIIAALPGELKPLVSPRTGARWERLKAGKGTVLWEHRHAGGRWMAGCSGMGGERAAITLREMERYGAVEGAICSVGWAGGLDEQMSAASVWRVAEIVDTRTGERLRTAEARGAHTVHWPTLATTSRVAGDVEKGRLAAAYGARLVDMEAATLARIAEARKVPFFCIKAVSDDMDARLPDLNPFIMKSGRLRMMPFLAHVAVRPRSWHGLRKLGRHSGMAAIHLAAVVQNWLDESVGEGGERDGRDA